MAEYPRPHIVYAPPATHRCQIVPDLRQQRIELPTGPALAPTGHRTVSFPARVDDVPGTVRACSCGRTWVAYRLPPGAGYASGFDVRWRPEGRLARWWRERRASATPPVGGERSDYPNPGDRT
jgi:hypothetical protein